MIKLLKIVLVLLTVVMCAYLLKPYPQFPAALPNSLKSTEPGDMESPFRQAYYTDMSRDQVLEYYKNAFSGYLLNYPPEEAQTLIRDQTRSTFLQEVVQPMRVSLFVNGFEPKDDKDAIVVNGKRWRQKVTVKYVFGSSVASVLIVLAAIGASFVLLSQWVALPQYLIKRKYK